MRTVADWLGEYGASHQNPTNKRLHSICVPLIVLSVFGLLWSAPVPETFAAVSPWLNWATVAAAATLVYYLALSPTLATSMAVVFILLLLLMKYLTTLSRPLPTLWLVLFVIAWIGQFAGHAIEGKRASFLQDAQFLLIGPLWLVAAAYRRLGLSY